MAPFHVTHHLEFLHQSFLAVPRDAFRLRRLIGWWDQHLIRAFSQGNLMVSKQMIQAGSGGARSRAGARWRLSKLGCAWEEEKSGWLRKCRETRLCWNRRGRSSALRVRQPHDTVSWDFRRASHWERWLVFIDTDCSWDGNGKTLLRTVVNITCWF